MTQYRMLEHFVDYSWRNENEASYPEKAVFQTAPFQRDITICGTIELNAYIALNVPDTDLEAILYEIRPDGTCVYLTSDIKRARYRNSLQYPKLVKRNEVEEYTFNTFHSVCRTLNAGSRLRLVFGALNSPYYEKNYNSGKEVFLETDKAARPAVIKIGHGKSFPSSLVLPVKK
jgi:predicted acyl esterase